MSCALLLTLLPPLLLAQVIPDSTFGNTTELESNPTGWLFNGTGPSESPSSSPPLEDWTAAETFLYSGDSTMLETGECSRAYSPPGRSGPLPWSFYQPLQPAIDALVNTANFLNMIFQASDLRESSVGEDLEWYHALVRALLEAQPLIRRALFTFDADPTTPVPQLVLRASRNSAPKVQTILLQDLTSEWQRLHPPPPAPDDSWFRSFKFPLANKPLATPLSKRLLLNDLNTLDTPKWGQGDSYVTNQSGVRWADAPFLECEDGHFLPGWLLTLSTSFYGLKPDLTPEFRGVIRVDVNIQDFDIDQCATGDSWFSNTHQCNRTTMKCEPIPEQGFRLGQYCCRCKEGFYSHQLDSQDTGEDLVLNETDGVSGGMGGAACYPAVPVCLPCWPGCRQCQDGSPCWVQEDWFLRAGVLAVQGLFMLLVFISMLVAYQHRRSRRIRASGLLLLETILFGSLLLYFPVFILYFKPSTFRCILLRWVRMLGFAIVYGTVTLKMYRVLRVFLSRTAQRVPYMSSLHLLRMLGVIVGTVSWFLCAWTVGVLQNRERNIPLLITSITSDGQGFSLCDLDRWDYMMAVAELLFLCWGSFLCSAVKPVPSAFHEPRYMGIAIHNELLLSSTFHLLRFVLPSLHPDWMLMLFFTHTHVTITVTLALLFIPKFLHVSRPGREEIAAEVYEDEVDLRRSGSYLNSSFHSAWSDHSLDPDDIRDELKKLYAQLEVHKTKKMTTNNPHLQKKRSSRRGLGRSIIKRITEIPESMSRQCSREDKDISMAGRNVDQSRTFKEIPDTRSVNHKNDSVKLPSPVLRKSQSEHDCVRDKDPSLHDSMMRANMAKRASRQSETDSLDIAPLICKSASAQNLTMDNNLLHPERKLHKSQSLSSPRTQVVEIAQVNMCSSVKTQSLKTRSGLDITIKDQTTSALQSHSFDKAEICPWEMEVERPTDKSQKHVTYAPSQSDDPKSPDSLSSPLVHVCPWDHVPGPAPVAETNLEADCESPKPQAHISASVPNTPKAPKDQRVFSFRNSTQRWLSVKGFIGSVDASLKEKSKREMDGKLKKEDSIFEHKQESRESTSPATQSTPASRNPSLEKKLLQKRRTTTVEGKPCLVKQNAVRMLSGDSSERSPRRLLIVKSTVYPCEADDKQKDSMYENVFVSRQNSARSNISCWEAGSSISSRTPSTHRRGSNKMTPTLSISHADVCPWDVPDSSKQCLQKQQSIIADICPWEVEDTRLSEKASVGHWQSQEEDILKRRASVHADVCPWESQDSPTTSNTSMSIELLQKQGPLSQKATDICPWEAVQNLEPSKRQESRAGVCPWDVQESPVGPTHTEVIYENVNPSETTGLVKEPIQQKDVRPNVCPWESDDTATEGKKYEIDKSATMISDPQLAKKMIATAASCPWEFPEPLNSVTDICPQEESLKPLVIEKTKESSLQEATTIKINICPWETEEQERHDSKKADVCPWETGDIGTTIQKDSNAEMGSNKTETLLRNNSPNINICPWETEELENIEPQDNTKTAASKTIQNIPKQDSAQTDVGPLETESFQIKQEDNGTRGNVCPWETEEPEKTEKDFINQTDVFKGLEKTKRQDSAQPDVCPWETTDQETCTRKASLQADICPWETTDQETSKRKVSLQADVCPWETTDQETSKRKASLQADVCPWETTDQETSKRKASLQADVCPWETTDQKTSKRKASLQADVCPWETTDQETSKRKASLQADVCPWETTDQETSKRKASIQADVCPLEPTDQETSKRKASLQADVCPWETTDQESSKGQASIQADVCPWESEGQEKSTESSVHMSSCGIDQVTESLGELSNEVAQMAPIDMKVNIPLARRDALCPWDMEQDSVSDVFTWEPENIPEEEEEEEGDAESAAEAFLFPSDL